jgi:uncharacterized protein (TIGR00255 family)
MKRYQLKSMTAYGRGSALFPYGRFTIELQSVNRRTLEINLTCPRLFAQFEIEMRKLIAASVGRGVVTATLLWRMDEKQPVTIVPNLSLARSLKNAWERIASELGIEGGVTATLLAQEKDLFFHEEQIGDERVYKEALQRALKEALDALIVMKEQEGEVLAADLKERLSSLREGIGEIAIHSSQGVEKYRQKLTTRLTELFSGAVENEERILREIAVYAERVDITEEIVRFKAHLDRFEHLLDSPLESETETRGKVLDFLIQELLREINTVGSKASDLAIAQLVVMMKGELEKIREQVQNIE